AAALASRLWERSDAAAGLSSDLLLMMADATREVGNKDQAAIYRNRAEEMIELARRSGIAPEYVDIRRAVLDVYDGRDQEAVARWVGTLPVSRGRRGDLALPIARRLAQRPDFKEALRTFDATLAEQRGKVVRMLCGPDQVSSSWQPAPGTCTRT